MVLLGPFGLLCGLKGKHTTSSSQTWWACRKCGKEFLERDTAKEVMDTAIERNAGITFIICLIWEFLFTCYGYNAWVRNIAMLMIIGIWFGISGISTELTGYTIQQLFTNEERWNFYKRSALYAIGSFLLGIVIGAKVMQFLFTWRISYIHFLWKPGKISVAISCRNEVSFTKDINFRFVPGVPV